MTQSNPRQGGALGSKAEGVIPAAENTELAPRTKQGKHPLLRYIAVRAVVSVLLIFGVTLVTFIITNLVPADPVQAMLGERASADPEVVANYRRMAGLDKPLPQRYIIYLTNLVNGDWGVSNQTRQPILDMIGRALPASMELGSMAIVISVGLGLVLGMLAALKRNKFSDQVIRVVSLLGVSAPTFWLATLGYYLFFYKLGVVPGSGRLDPGFIPPPNVTGFYTIDALLAGDTFTFWNAVSHLILPATVLSLFTVGMLTRYTRSSVLEVLGQDYVRAARAKGLTNPSVTLRYILRGALVPIITVVGLAFGSLLSGAVLTETVFGWHGLGQMAFMGATQLDLPVIMGVALVIGSIYIIVNFIVDLAYGLIDPRVKVR